MKATFTLKSTLIALLVMFCCVMKAEIVTYTKDGLSYSLNTETRTAGLVRYDGDAAEVVVPEFVTYEENEYTVTWLGESCFRGCSSLTSIELPESVEWLGNYCFQECSSLTSIKIPSSVKSLSDYCFTECSSLKSIEIPASVISFGKDCFAGCYARESIVVDADNPKYDSREGCNALIETESNTMILGGRNTRIPDSVTSLKNGCFSYCSSLTSIVIPASLTNLGSDGNCFAGCYSLESIVVDAANPKYDSREGCNAIIETESNTMIAGCKSTRFPESVTSLGNFCFAYGPSPTSIVIPESVTSLGVACFSGCSSLTSIEIPESVTDLGLQCFSGCPSLTAVICKMGNVIADGSLFGFWNNHIETATLYVPAEKLDTYKATSPWSNFGTILPLFDLPDVTLYLGEEVQMSANVLPGYAGNKTLDWSSSNPDVATVDANGDITAIGLGETTITATVTDGSSVSASCHVTVLPLLAESLTVTPDSWDGMEGDSFTLVATVLPENATDKSVSWSSSDSEIAMVDAEGNVHVLKDGYCTITVSTLDGSNLSAECVITSVSGIDAIFKDANASFDIYNLQGVLIKEGCHRDDLKQLPTGAYILRQGNTRKKIMIR